MLLNSFLEHLLAVVGQSITARVTAILLAMIVIVVAAAILLMRAIEVVTIVITMSTMITTMTITVVMIRFFSAGMMVRIAAVIGIGTRIRRGTLGILIVLLLVTTLAFRLAMSFAVTFMSMFTAAFVVFTMLFTLFTSAAIELANAVVVTKAYLGGITTNLLNHSRGRSVDRLTFEITTLNDFSEELG